MHYLSRLLSPAWLTSGNTEKRPAFRLYALFSFTVAFLFICLAGNASASGVSDIAYAWQSGEVYRFEYFKSTLVKQANEEGVLEERKTEISGVLILEMDAGTKGAKAGTKSSSAETRTAAMRIDSPHVVLPEIRFFSAAYDAPQIQKDKNRAVAKAIEGSISKARWTVTLGSNGAFHVDGRTPANPRDWLKDVELAGAWRQKSMPIMLNDIEQDLGFKASGDERDMFLCIGAVPAASAAAGPGAALHPARTGLTPASTTVDKVQFSFTRQAPPANGGIADKPTGFENVTITLNTVTTNEGNAVFDVKLGMIDSINESYDAGLTYRVGSELLNQNVRVQYRLKRLAPAIVKAE